MITWLKNWLLRRRMQRERELFRFFDGQRMRTLDPLKIHFDLELHPKFNWDDGAMISQLEPEAHQNVLVGICDCFGVQPWNDETQQGLTSLELLNILDQYLAYTQAVKKNISPGQTLPPATEPASYPSPEVPETATSSSADCSSI